ncbi:hypothetical protein [Anaerosporobacter sp.]|uniref:hypothetical protein n=1 Tax=Anaerosporobacter sp. TaxID=1872529 RepID=UPI00286ED830|nr:hypothetical protein [Anaerosporobacter sp.]
MNRTVIKRWMCLGLAGMLFIMLLAFGVSSDIEAASNSEEHLEDCEGKKIISVVYDDSHSMVRNDNWSYCNYAFQLFTSLCEDVDDFYVTYMSSAVVSSNLFEKNKDLQTVVNKIRSTFGVVASTPIKSVETAFDKLLSVESTDIHDEYWLVVMSDGVFNSGTTRSGVADINNCLNEYADVQMTNGTYAHTIYLSIGNEAATPNGYNEKQIYVERASNKDDIIDALVNIARLIFGLVEIEHVNFAEYHFTDNKTMEFATKLNLEDMIVITEETTGVVSSAKSKEDNSRLHVSTIKLRYPERQGIKTDTSLYGSENTINTGNVIPRGTYTVRFSEKMEQERILVLVKPDVALLLDCYYTGTDTFITDESSILQSDVLDIRCRLIEKSTGRTLLEEEFCDSYAYSISAVNEGNILGEVDAKTLEELILKLDTVNLRGTFYFTGNTITASEIIKPIPHVLYEINGETQDSNKYSVDTIYGKSLNTKFQIIGNGIQLNRKEIKELDLSFYPQKYASFITLKQNCTMDGLIDVTAQIDSNSIVYKTLFGWIPTWLMGDDEIIVCAKINSPYQQDPIIGYVTVRLNDDTIVQKTWNYIQPILMFILVFGFIFKKRFVVGSKVSYCRLKSKREELRAYKYDWHSYRFDKIVFRMIHRPVSWTSFVPFIPNRIVLGDYYIYANHYFWSRKEKIKVVCRNKKVSVIKLVDTRTISSQDDLDLRNESTRIIEELENTNSIQIYYQQGAIFICEDEILFYKYTI